MSGLTVQEVQVSRIAGVVPDKAFTLKDLPAGLVLIHGPNGSGKSTTAAAIQELLWPEERTREYLELRATVEAQESTWDLEIRGNRVRALQGSSTVPHPGGVATDLRARYHWSLKTLLESQDGDLASALAAEMAGGVDFTQLARTLGWDKAPSAPQKLSKELREAERRLQDLRKEQEHLRQESEQLTSEREELEHLEHLRDRGASIQHALEHLQKRKELKELEEQMAHTSKGVQQVQPGDAERAQRLLGLLQTAEEELYRLRLEQEGARLENPLPNYEGSDEDLKALRRFATQFEVTWKDLSHQRNRVAEALAEATEEERSIRERLGFSEDTKLPNHEYDLPAFRTWSESVFELGTLDAQITHLKTQLTLDPELILPDSEELQSLAQELRTLRDALNKGLFSDLIPLGLSWAALLGVLLAADTSNAQWTFLLLPAAIALGVAWRPLQTKMLMMDAQQSVAELFPEETLTAQNIRIILRKTEALLQEPPRRTSLSEAEVERAKLDAMLRDAREDLDALGIDASVDQDWTRHFLEDVQLWRNAKTLVAEKEAGLGEWEKQLDAILEDASTEAKHIGKAFTHDDPQLDAIELRETAEEALAARSSLRNLTSRLEETTQRSEENRKELASIATRLGLSAVEVSEVQRLEKLHQEWDGLFRRSEVLRAQSSELRKHLEDVDPELLMLEEPALLSLKLQSDEAAHLGTALRDRISKLEQRIDTAGSQRSLHDALETVDMAREALLEEREAQAEIRAGQAILDWLRASCQEEDQPEVLEEANRLLSVFTKGSLQLNLDLEHQTHSFLASTEGLEPRPLEELSTGERTQVLMAARLAFLSKHEHAAMPLLIDEALGTSDDERAEAIMETLLQVVREGRQVFYFTAQTDEVAKWKKTLEEENPVPHLLIDLDALRNGTPATPIFLPEEREASEDPARRPGESTADWARRLGVPAWNGHDSIETLPLFLLMANEEEALTTCLRFGLTTWGPLKTLMEAGSSGSLVSTDQASRLGARASAYEAIAAAWRIGRPQPVDPATVLESDAVSDTFADEILALLEHTGYDAARFLAALENKAVKKWRQDNTDELRAMFYEQGTLTDEEPLSEEQMLSQALVNLKGEQPLSPEDWRSVAQTLLSASSGIRLRQGFA